MLSYGKRLPKLPLQHYTPIQTSIDIATSPLMIPWSKNETETGAYNILPETSNAKRRSLKARRMSMSTTRAAGITSMLLVQKTYIHKEDFTMTGGDALSISYICVSLNN